MALKARTPIAALMRDNFSAKKMHYSMFIQGSPTNGLFEWINRYKYRNFYITSMNILFRPNPLMFNNVDTTNVVTSTNGEEVTIPPGYYTIGEVIAMLNTMTDTTFLISLHRFYQCSRHPCDPRFGRANGYSTCFVLWIECDRYHAQSPSDPGVFLAGAIL